MCHTSSSFIVKNNNNNNKPSRDDGKKKEPKKARASKSSFSFSFLSLDDAIFAFYFLDATQTKEREISTWQRKARVLTFSLLRLYHISEIAQRERERERVSSDSKEQQQRQQQSTDHVRGDERRGRDDDDELSFRRRKGLNYYYVSTSIRFEEKLCDQ